MTLSDIPWPRAAGFMLCALCRDRPGFTVSCALNRPKLILYVNAHANAESGLVWEIDNVCLFLTYEVQSANSSPFISLCIVYSNIGHRAHKSSPCSAKTAPFVCTVLTDSILCLLTSSPLLSLSLLLSAQLYPLEIH